MSDPGTGVCLAFHRCYAQLRMQLDDELGIHHGISFDDFALLQALAKAEDDATSLVTLAAELGAAPSSMLRRLRPLEKIGLVASHGGVTNRRIALRPAGRSLMKTAHDTVGGVCARLSLNAAAKRLNDALLMLGPAHRSYTDTDKQ